jgi:hypothetical protein
MSELHADRWLDDPATRLELDLHDIDRAAEHFEAVASAAPFVLADYRDGLADLGARLIAIAAELPRTAA